MVKRNTIKRFAAASTAVIIAGSMLMTTPLVARAVDIVQSDEQREENNDHIYINYGDITINGENGRIDSNEGNVVNNNGSIDTSSGYVVNNNATIDYNRAIVVNNNDGASVNNNMSEITNNKEGAEIGLNTSRGTVVNNEGKVGYNNGKIENNYGTVGINNNSAVVKNNYGIIEDNFNGIVENNAGRVINNFNSGGSITGTPAEHQWWLVGFTGAYSSSEVKPEYDGENSDFEYDNYLEEAEGKKGVLILRAQEGYRVTTGTDEVNLPTTCSLTMHQDGNDYVITVTAITGSTYLTLQDLNLIITEAISQNPNIGGNIEVIIDNNISVNEDDDDGSDHEAGVTANEIPGGAITIAIARTNTATHGYDTVQRPSVLGAGRSAGSIPTRTVKLRMALLTDSQYKDAVINNINATPAGGTLRIEVDRMACFDRKMLEAFAKKSNIDLQVVFPLGSIKMCVTIPAGTDIDKLLDDKGYCGFLHLLAILGGENLEK